MTHHHNHARRHTRLNADTRRKLATEDSGNDVQPAHHHHHQHRDVHSQPETHTSNDSTANEDEPAPIAHHDIDRRSAEVVQTVTTYVATEYDLLIESGTSTLGEFTVSTLPAVVTVPNFGVITVPANAGSLVTGAFPSPVFPSPVETSPPAAAATGATAMVATANRQVPLVSSKTTSSSISETSQPPATQSVASGTSASSDVDTAAATKTSISSASTTSGVSTTSISSISNSKPTTSISNSIPDSSTISAITSTSGFSATTSGDASASSTTDPASSASSSSGSSTLSADSTASSGDGGIPLSPTSSSSPSSTAGAVSSGSPGGTNETPKIAGGVVGGVLGFLAVLVFAFLFLRWKRKRASAAGVERTFGRDGVLGDTQSFSPRAPESSWRRSSNTPIAAGAFLRGRQPSTPGYPDESPTGERGFQKISGRKIQSVLRTGGDGYGDEIEEEPIPENPFEPGSPVSPVSTFHGDSHPAPLVRLDSGDGAMMRPSPARTPTTASSVDLMGSSPPWQLGVAPLRPDSVGRSLPRQDGSRNSRFTERI